MLMFENVGKFVFFTSRVHAKHDLLVLRLFVCLFVCPRHLGHTILILCLGQVCLILEKEIK